MGAIPFTNVDATNLNCRCVPAYRYVCWLTWVYHYALHGAFPLTFPYTYTRNLKVSNEAANINCSATASEVTTYDDLSVHIIIIIITI